MGYYFYDYVNMIACLISIKFLLPARRLLILEECCENRGGGGGGEGGCMTESIEKIPIASGGP